MKSTLDVIIEKLMSTGMTEMEACVLIAKLLDEEAEDYLELKKQWFEITLDDLDNLKELFLSSSHKFS